MATQHGTVLSWTNPNPPSQSYTYNVYRGTAAGGEDYANPIASGLTAMTFFDTTGTPGTTYFYTETIINSGGIMSDPGNEVSEVFPTTPQPPSQNPPTVK